MQSQCDDEYSECSQPLSDAKLQLEDDIMDDSQYFCLDFDNDSDTGVIIITLIMTLISQ